MVSRGIINDVLKLYYGEMLFSIAQWVIDILLRSGKYLRKLYLGLYVLSASIANGEKVDQFLQVSTALNVRRFVIHSPLVHVEDNVLDHCLAQIEITVNPVILQQHWNSTNKLLLL